MSRPIKIHTSGQPPTIDKIEELLQSLASDGWECTVSEMVLNPSGTLLAFHPIDTLMWVEVIASIVHDRQFFPYRIVYCNEDYTRWESAHYSGGRRMFRLDYTGRFDVGVDFIPVETDQRFGIYAAPSPATSAAVRQLIANNS